ncbi:MAG: hypothetical protein AAF483_18915 [Planctomycetota bacterium]
MVFDPRSMFGADENALNTNEMLLASVARKISRALDCAVVYVGHVSKQVVRSNSYDQYAGRGGTAQADNSRFVWNLTQEKTEEKRKLDCTVPLRFREHIQHGWVFKLSIPKMSYGARPAPIYIHRNLVNSPFEFEFAEEALPTEDESREIADSEQLKVMRLVVTEVNLMADQGNQFSKSHLTTLLSNRLRVSQGVVAAALEQAVNEGFLFIVVEGRSRRCSVTDKGRSWLTS